VVNFPEFVKLGIKLITKEASCEYMSESTLGDPIALILRVGKVSHVRLELLFTFIHKISGKVVSKGRQVIVFGGPNGKPVGIPSMILKGIAPYR
jgi:acyl-CoA thioesterase FadM